MGGEGKEKVTGRERKGSGKRKGEEGERGRRGGEGGQGWEGKIRGPEEGKGKG